MATTFLPESEGTIYSGPTGTTSSVLGVTAVVQHHDRPGQKVESFLVAICLVGFTINLVSLINQLLVRRQTGRKTVNTFMCNQTVLDLVSTFVMSCKMMLSSAGYFSTQTGLIRKLVCVLIESDALVSSAVYGSVYGLVVITVERYAKIVYPVAHRNRYRRWMTRAGVAIPWFVGILTSSIPSLTTTRFINGRCVFMLYPNQAVMCVARVALFSWRFVVPLVVFAFCYGKIFLSLHRSAKVCAPNAQPPVAAGPSHSASGGAAAEHPGAGGDCSKPLSKTQKNVIKITIAVILCFVVCWLPFQFWLLIVLCDPEVTATFTMYYIFVIIAFGSLCVNPFIYWQNLQLRANCVGRLRRLIRLDNQPVNAVEPVDTTTLYRTALSQTQLRPTSNQLA